MKLKNQEYEVITRNATLLLRHNPNNMILAMDFLKEYTFSPRKVLAVKNLGNSHQAFIVGDTDNAR